MRSDRYDVNKCANYYGGGGHKAAAGFKCVRHNQVRWVEGVMIVETAPEGFSIEESDDQADARLWAQELTSDALAAMANAHPERQLLFMDEHRYLAVGEEIERRLALKDPR